MPISTHVLDTTRGAPAAGVRVTLERYDDGEWKATGQGVTNSDGRVKDLASEVRKGRYRLRFDTGSYDRESFFPEVVITFEVRDASQNYHVPLLLSRFGYSTYRGS